MALALGRLSFIALFNAICPRIRSRQRKIFPRSPRVSANGTQMTQTKNRYLERICAEVNTSEPLEAVSRFVLKYRDPGDNLQSLCAKLGVSSVSREKLPFEGGVFCEAG